MFSSFRHDVARGAVPGLFYFQKMAFRIEVPKSEEDFYVLYRGSKEVLNADTKKQCEDYIEENGDICGYCDGDGGETYYEDEVSGGNIIRAQKFLTCSTCRGYGKV